MLWEQVGACQRTTPDSRINDGGIGSAAFALATELAGDGGDGDDVIDDDDVSVLALDGAAGAP